MVRTDTSFRLMGLLLDGKPLTDKQLADAIGFKNPRNIARHLESFASSGYIRILPQTGRDNYRLFQLTDKKDGLLKLYQSRFYRVLRPRIREIDWFIDQVAAGFSPLPRDLFNLIREMMKKSHTFFSLIAGHSSHDQLLSSYSLYLFPCSLMNRDDPLFQACYLYAQLYAESITRDIREGGLSEGFLEPLDAIQKVILQLGPPAITDSSRDHPGYKGLHCTGQNPLQSS